MNHIPGINDVFQLNRLTRLHNGKNVFFCNDIKKACSGIDLVIIHTEWEEFKVIEFKKLFKNRKIKIFDMRNLYSPSSMKKKGFLYYSIGR